MEQFQKKITLTDTLRDQDGQNSTAILYLKSINNSRDNEQNMDQRQANRNSAISELLKFQQTKKSNNKYPQNQTELSQQNLNKVNQYEEILQQKILVNSSNKNHLAKKKDNSNRLNRKKKRQEIKNVISNQKINLLKQYFVQKLKRNNQCSPPVDHVFQEDQKNISLLDIKGIQIKQHIDIILNIIFFLNIIATTYFISLSIVFWKIKESQIYSAYKKISCFILGVQVVLNFITVKFCLGKKLNTIKLISKEYIKSKFNIDLINLLIIFCSLVNDYWLLNLMSMTILLKIPECSQKLQKLQVYFIQNYYNEQYWQLIKVLIFNFCFAHILSILLIGMGSLNRDNNWIKQKNLQNASWAQVYIWAYYWGTTLMLTIGFGDITPVCSQQAVCMVFIQTISCIILAYNINCVGTLISNIRQQDLQKSKKLKMFRKLVKKNKMNEENSWKINNFIQQHSNMKKLFNIQEQKTFVNALPIAYRNQYLKEANKTIFNQLFYLGSLMESTLFSLAENIEMKVTHPQEIILQKQINLDLYILKAGQISFISQKKNRSYSHYMIDRVKVNQNQKPFLLNTNFITFKRSPYIAKSIVYSILYFLNKDKLLSIFRQNSIDFEIFCMMRDKCKFKIDQFQVFVCEYCKTKHTKFDCPKLHYIPIEQHVIHKFLHLQKVSKNKRFNNFQRNKQQESALMNYSFYKQVYDQNKKKQQKQFYEIKKIKLGVIKQLKTLICQDQYELNTSQHTIYSYQIKGKSLYDEIIQKQTIQKVQKTIIQNTEEVMKYYLSKTINSSPCQDSIWTLDLDHMKNYKNYFNLDNPSNVDKKFDLDERLKKIHQKQITSAIALIFDDKDQFKKRVENIKQSYKYHQNLIQNMRQKSYGRQKSIKYSTKHKYNKNK